LVPLAHWRTRRSFVVDAPVALSSPDSNQLRAKAVPLAAVGRDALAHVGGKSASLGDASAASIEVRRRLAEQRTDR
jgi:hypothetical protein